MPKPKSSLSYFKYLFPSKIEQKIFFLHIPKCGGTSIIDAIENQYGLAEVISRRHFFALNPEAFTKAASILEEDSVTYRERLLLYYMSSKQMKCISGHFKYSEKAMQNFGDDWNFVTLLRHPVSRFFSYYFMDRYADFVPSFAKIDVDLKSFLNLRRGIYHGCEYVMAFTTGIPLENASSKEAIEEAIDNINKFSLVGILERMDIFYRDYYELFGAKLKIKRFNTSVLSKQKQHEMITDEIEQKVRQLCQPSLEVYNAVKNKILDNQQ